MTRIVKDGIGSWRMMLGVYGYEPYELLKIAKMKAEEMNTASFGETVTSDGIVAGPYFDQRGEIYYTLSVARGAHSVTEEDLSWHMNRLLGMIWKVIECESLSYEDRAIYATDFPVQAARFANPIVRRLQNLAECIANGKGDLCKPLDPIRQSALAYTIKLYEEDIMYNGCMNQIVLWENILDYLGRREILKAD